MMQHNTIVPHCGIKPGSKINHNYPDLEARNVHIAFQPKPWPRTKNPRRVLINNALPVVTRLSWLKMLLNAPFLTRKTRERVTLLPSRGMWASP